MLALLRSNRGACGAVRANTAVVQDAEELEAMDERRTIHG